MILDTSAIIAVTLEEESADGLLRKLYNADVEGVIKGVGAPTLTEAGLVLASRLGRNAEDVLGDFLNIHALNVVAFSEVHWREAVRAFYRFGKGRHPAGLNFGDCLSYAAAKVAQKPLLYIGNDFAQTDLERA